MPIERQWARITFRKILKAFLRITPLEEYIIPMGRFTLPGWSGHAMWYLFHCRECDAQSVDYLHGHDHYLICESCEARRQVSARRFYVETGMPLPPRLMTRKERREASAKL